MLLLTIFLRHDQSQTLDEIQARLKQTGFYESFPPPGVEVVSWHVVMGIGQVVTLRLPVGAPTDGRDNRLSFARRAAHGHTGSAEARFCPQHEADRSFRPGRPA